MFIIHNSLQWNIESDSWDKMVFILGNIKVDLLSF
jgi:hypothetical protein